MKGSVIPLSMYFMLVHVTKSELRLGRACVMLEKKKLYKPAYGTFLESLSPKMN